MAHPAQKLTSENIKFTYEDYLLLPDDGKRYEIIEGELYMAPAPNTKHQNISSELFRRIANFVVENNLGLVYCAPYDILFSDANIVQPDILFISKTNRFVIKDKNVQGAPDLIVEITSPSTKKRDIALKKRLYGKFKVKEYWIAFAEEEKVEVWRLLDNDYVLDASYDKKDILKSPLLQGLAIKLSEVFRDIEDYF